MKNDKSTTISADYLRLAIAVSSSSASLPLTAVKREDVCITDCVPSETLYHSMLLASFKLLGYKNTKFQKLNSN